MISKEKLENIVDNVLTDIKVDVENSGDLADFEVEIILRSINWFYDILKDRIYDYLEFYKESE